MTATTVMVSVKNKIPSVIKQLSPRQMKGLMDSIGLRLEDAFKGRIDDGDSSWAPLSAGWVAVKGHSEPWYHTTRLQSAIEYTVSGLEIHAGILDRDSYPEGETVATVAAMLEYGTMSIPARPLFAPEFERQESKIIEAATKDIKARIKKGAL